MTHVADVSNKGPASRLAMSVAEELVEAMGRDAFSGWDPYDALASPFLREAARTRFLQQCSIQALKRSPVNLRRLLKVPKKRHSKALALAISGLVRLGERQRAEELADDLLSKAIPRGDGIGWGYDFDVVTRWGSYRRGEPNAVATAFCGHALLDLGVALEEVGRACRYVACELFRPVGELGYFAYHELATVPIHNASLMLSSLVARHGGDLGATRLAERALEYSLAGQARDGSWPYGDAPGLGWVDGYHTAYNLDALALWMAGRRPDVETQLRHGLRLYVSRLIDLDGAPRHTLDRRYPIDIHAAATAVAVLSRLSALEATTLEVAERVLCWTLANMRRRDGRFAFQLHRRYRNSVPYVRWNDAHMLYALACFIEAVGA